ncbi:hypothetical protein [Vibrio mediterranei]|uniref:hypothetical protein n=1 Tax=Vibrio mediterranei TaxID=689 RepID=UPI0040680CEA
MQAELIQLEEFQSNLSALILSLQTKGYDSIDPADLATFIARAIPNASDDPKAQERLNKLLLTGLERGLKRGTVSEIDTAKQAVDEFEAELRNRRLVALGSLTAVDQELRRYK